MSAVEVSPNGILPGTVYLEGQMDVTPLDGNRFSR